MTVQHGTTGYHLLKDLHALALAGRNDSEEADAIREQLDGLWRGLSDEERTFLQELSRTLAEGEAARIET